MNNSTYVEYPRIRFILRPKFRKEYNPTATYGKEDEVYYIKGNNLNEHKDSSSNEEYVDEPKENLDIEEMFQKQNGSDLDNNIIKDSSPLKEDKKDIPNESKKEDGVDDEEPEWANDNVDDFYNTKIEFKSIPKSIEDKMEEKFGFEKNEIKEMNLNTIEDKNNIDINNFFRSNSENSINGITNQNNDDGDNNSNKSNNSNNGNDMIFKDIKDFMKNQINENQNKKENPDSTNENNDNGNNSLKDSEKSDIINENFNIFEKFKNIFIDDKNSNNSNNNEQQNENKINDNFNNKNGKFFSNNNKINNIENNSVNR